jgi:hypothetical protein
MIGIQNLSQASWPSFVQLVLNPGSIFLRKANGKQMTGEHSRYIMYNSFIYNRRHLYRPQFVVDGNMKLVNLYMKRPQDDVSLFDGGLFNVERGPYAKHLVSAPERQHVGFSHSISLNYSESATEISM